MLGRGAAFIQKPPTPRALLLKVREVLVAGGTGPRSESADRHIDALWRYAAMLNLGFVLLGGAALWANLRDRPPTPQH